MKIFLDDIRYPKECLGYMHRRIGEDSLLYLTDWFIVRNYNEFVDVINKNYLDISHISFDHDLADEHMQDYYKNQVNGENTIEYSNFKEKTGVSCAEYIKEFYNKNNMKYPKMYVHSMNPVGTQNIINVFKQK